MACFKPLKIKYGEITRRFNVPLTIYNQLDLDINGLRAKIFEFFNFSSDTDFTLTYIDEDGDTLSLVNNDDLLDMFRMEKGRKIYVHLRTEKNNEFHDRSDGASTPLMSARSFPNVCSGISEVLKEPSKKLSSQSLLDVASKAAVASSALAELAHCFIQLANTHLNSDLQSSVSETSTQKVAIESSVAPGFAFKDKFTDI